MSGTSTKLMEVWNWLAEDNLNIFFFKTKTCKKESTKLNQIKNGETQDFIRGFSLIRKDMSQDRNKFLGVLILLFVGQNRGMAKGKAGN